MLLLPEYEAISFGNDEIRAKRDGKWSYYLAEEEVFLPGEFEEAEHFLGSFAWVKKDGVWGLVDRAGNFREGLARAWQNGQWGYVDNHGKVVDKFHWDKAGDFRDGFAQVRKDGDRYVID